MSEEIRDLFDGNTFIDQTGCQTVAEQMGAVAWSLDSPASQVSAHDGADRARHDRTLRSAVAEEHLRHGKSWTLMKNIVGEGYSDLLS
jgi:hypothetical protein